jgi:hypothetical protein
MLSVAKICFIYKCHLAGILLGIPLSEQLRQPGRNTLDLHSMPMSLSELPVNLVEYSKGRDQTILLIMNTL